MPSFLKLPQKEWEIKKRFSTRAKKENSSRRDTEQIWGEMKAQADYYLEGPHRSLHTCSKSNHKEGTIQEPWKVGVRREKNSNRKSVLEAVRPQRASPSPWEKGLFPKRKLKPEEFWTHNHQPQKKAKVKLETGGIRSLYTKWWASSGSFFPLTLLLPKHTY